jgi:hypothetical protein
VNLALHQRPRTLVAAVHRKLMAGTARQKMARAQPPRLRVTRGLRGFDTAPREVRDEHAPDTLTTWGGWSAPTATVVDEFADYEPAQMPEIFATPGAPRYGDPDAAARRQAQRDEAQRALAAALGIPLAALADLNVANGTKRLVVRPGHWEYAIREDDGSVMTGGSFDAPHAYRSAQEAFDDWGLGEGRQMVRRWVADAGPWEVVR